MGALPPLGSAGPGDAGGLALRRERSAANEGLTGRSCDGARRGSADAPAPLLSGSYLKKRKEMLHENENALQTNIIYIDNQTTKD